MKRMINCNYIKSSSDDFKHRIYVYYSGDIPMEYSLANAVLDDALSKYGVQANLGYRNSKCRSLGSDVDVCIISSRKPIAKSKLKSIVADELGVNVIGIDVEDFETSFI